MTPEEIEKGSRIILSILQDDELMNAVLPRDYIITNPDHIDLALKIYKKIKKEGFGLLDIPDLFVIIHGASKLDEGKKTKLSNLLSYCKGFISNKLENSKGSVKTDFQKLLQQQGGKSKTRKAKRRSRRKMGKRKTMRRKK